MSSTRTATPTTTSPYARRSPGGAKIDPPGDKHGVHINANYVTLEGFDISGSQNAGITGVRVHHVEVINNIVHDNVSNGIFLGQSDFLLIEGNVVHGNAAKGSTSGIHLKGAFNVSGSKSDNGYRIIVRDNVAYDNVTKYGAKTDGNGISLDDFQNTQLKSLPSYKFKTLVEGNIVYSNFGRGIQAAWSDNATIRDNISMHNNKVAGLWASELNNMGSHNNIWTGNIAITDSKNPAIANVSFNGSSSNKNVSWTSNTTFNGRPGDDSAYSNANNSSPSASNGNKLGKDPGLSLSKVQALAKELTSFPDIGKAAALTAAVSVDTAAAKEVVSEAGDRIVGTNGHDKLVGGSGDDALHGGKGRDFLIGGAGDDVLVGGNGSDTMVGGGGDDVFVYRHTSNAISGDVIKGFADGDTIDLGEIDASTTKSRRSDLFVHRGEGVLGYGRATPLSRRRDRRRCQRGRQGRLPHRDRQPLRSLVWTISSSKPRAVSLPVKGPPHQRRASCVQAGRDPLFPLHGLLESGP